MSPVGLVEEETALGRAYDTRLARRIWAYTRPYRGAVALSVALFPLLAAVDLAQPYLVKVAIDAHILQADWGGLSGVATLFLATLVVQYALRYGQAYVAAWTGQHVVHDLRTALFAHVQRLPARFFDENPIGRLMTRMLGDPEAIGEVFTAGVVAIVGDAVTLVGVVTVMFLINARLALVTLAVVPLLAGTGLLFRQPIRRSYRAVRARLAMLNADLQETLVGMSVIQLFGREGARAAELARLTEAHRHAVFRRMAYDSTLYAAVEAVGGLAVAALLWWGGREILEGSLTFGVLVAFMQYTVRFYQPLRDAAAKYTVMQAAVVAAERIFALLDTPIERGGSVTSVPSREREDATPAIELRDVWFAYGDGVREGAAGGESGVSWVLRGVSLRIPRGQRVAVVGATGAGKTTLARLLTRIYDPQRGVVLVEGVDAREWDLTALRRHVGLVLQDVMLFAATVGENIALGSEVPQATVEAATRRAHADRFIARLPGGLDAPLVERAANLSQGQRQLLSIARALVYNPPVLVLDEATSSVDPETERLLQDAVDRLLSERTSIVIAHRLATIQRADRVIVLQGGAVVEDGSHEVLLRRGGVYRTLWELQFGTVDGSGHGLTERDGARA